MKYKIREDFAKQDYVNALLDLKSSHHIAHIATGDIDYVDNMPNWIAECAKQAEINAIFPLWQKLREEIFSLFFKYDIQFTLSYINAKEIADWQGRSLTPENINLFIKRCETHNIDLCGENGEYHSMVFAAPFLISKDN